MASQPATQKAVEILIACIRWIFRKQLILVFSDKEELLEILMVYPPSAYPFATDEISNGTNCNCTNHRTESQYGAKQRVLHTKRQGEFKR